MNKPWTHGALVGEETPEAQRKAVFLECLSLVERLHRRLLDVIKDELDQQGYSDINAVQALLVYNIGSHEMTAGELKSRGYYQGSNVSYNLKKLVELGYVHHERAEHDRRAVRISLTEQGYRIRQMIDTLYEQQLSDLLGDRIFTNEDLDVMRRNLRNLERFWSDRLRFSLS